MHGTAVSETARSREGKPVLCNIYKYVSFARRDAGKMQTYGAVEEVTAAAPKKKLGRKVVVAIAALGRARCRFTDSRSSQNAVCRSPIYLFSTQASSARP